VSDTARFHLDEHASTRAAMRRDMLRANTVVALVLAAVLALALVAVLAGLRAAQNLRRAEKAERDGREKLWNAYVAQARAMRAAAEAGHRQIALGVISNAIAIRPSSELRTEAMACFALSDFAQEGQLLPTPRDLAGVEVSPDLERYAYGDAQGTVFLCDAHDGKHLAEFDAKDLGNAAQVPAGDLCFSPNGRALAARFAGGTVVVWDLETHQRLMVSGVSSNRVTMTGLSFLALTGLAFSRDSSQIIFSDAEMGGQLCVFDVSTGRKLSSSIKVGMRLFRIRPDMEQVALASENKVTLVDYASGTNVQTLTHSARVAMMAWGPLGDQLAVSCEDGDIYLWDVARGTAHLFPGHSERCVRMGFSPDGSLLFSSSRDGTTRLWDVSLRHAIAAGEGIAHTFAPDGRRVGFWRPWDGVGIWRILPSQYYSVHGCARSEGPLFTIDLSPSGRWCVATQDKGFRVWDIEAGAKETYVAVPGVYCVRVAPDDQSLFICSQKGLEVWPLSTNQTGALELKASHAKAVTLPPGGSVRAVSLSLDGRWAAVEMADHPFCVVDLKEERAPVIFKERWRAVSYKGPGSPTGAGRFAISPDGRWVVTGFNFGSDDVPKVWDARTGELAATLPAQTSVAGFSPDGRRLGLAGVDRYSIWSTGDWKLEKEFVRDESSVAHGTLAFTKDSGLLAIARTRQIVSLRSTATGEQFDDLIGPTPQSVNSVRLSLDGSVLVTATANDMVEIWRLRKLRQQLAGMNLDWNDAGTPRQAAQIQTVGWRAWQTTLVASLAGFGLAAVAAVLTLRRHRAAIERFVAAEVKAAQRNRELETAKVELMHSQKMQALGTLATGIAHDFNNLLSVIRMSNTLVGRESKSNAEIQEHVTDIELAVLQGKSLVGSMLGYARNDNGDGGPTDVEAVVETTVSLLSREFLNGVAVTLELDREAPAVGVGRGRLEQILLNLVVNGSEAMQGQGKLQILVHARSSLPDRPYTLRPREAASYIELSVIDSGPGIAPAIGERLFEPFFTTKRSGAKPGTGLGLSLVYSIAEQEGLGLSVESEQGKGAAFTVVIPVQDVGF
jgi:WD40 repeat protein/nitrogen-specific signal transduction histidine kinase